MNRQLERAFAHVAAAKGLTFSVKMGENVPPTIHTDENRLMQVLKNLISNALKFTDARVGAASRSRLPHPAGTRTAAHSTRRQQVIAFTVSDTGLGIPADKQRIIFEAFQQADGTTSRKYGGTGLGLSISRELARLLGGQVRLMHSALGHGSIFTLYLPDAPAAGEERSPWAAEIRLRTISEPPRPVLASATTVPRSSKATSSSSSSTTTRHSPIYVLEIAHEQGSRPSWRGTAPDAMALARRYKPSAITLDILLGEGDGWSVLSALKDDPVCATYRLP